MRQVKQSQAERSPRRGVGASHGHVNCHRRPNRGRAQFLAAPWCRSPLRRARRCCSLPFRLPLPSPQLAPSMLAQLQPSCRRPKRSSPPLPSSSRTLLFWQVRTRRRDEVLTLLDIYSWWSRGRVRPLPSTPRPKSLFLRPDVGAPCHAPCPPSQPDIGTKGQCGVFIMYCVYSCIVLTNVMIYKVLNKN